MNLQKIIFQMSKKTKLNILDIELILAYVLKKSREFIIAHPEHKLTKSQIAKSKLLIKKRLKGVPIAYLTGHKEFYGLDFKVNKNVLIPRPETELMIEEASNLITRNPQPITLVDIGTGSGCIIITLASLIKNCKLLAIDISEKALVVTKQNAKLNNVYKKIKFLKGDLLKPIINSKFVIHNSKLIITANLPYLTPTQIKNSPTIKYEPKLALTAGLDGLKYYRQLFKQIKTLPNVKYVLCEIDPSQTLKIKKLIKRELPKANCQIKKDLSGLNRLVVISISSTY
jgi:release factor glutamine methyltransferase